MGSPELFTFFVEDTMKYLHSLAVAVGTAAVVAFGNWVGAFDAGSVSHDPSVVAGIGVIAGALSRLAGWLLGKIQ